MGEFPPTSVVVVETESFHRNFIFPDMDYGPEPEYLELGAGPYSYYEPYWDFDQEDDEYERSCMRDYDLLVMYPDDVLLKETRDLNRVHRIWSGLLETRWASRDRNKHGVGHTANRGQHRMSRKQKKAQGTVRRFRDGERMVKREFLLS
jgi:hypothetical protein